MTSFSRKAKAEAAKYKHQISPKAQHKYTFNCGAGDEGGKGLQPGNTCGGDGDGKDDAAAEREQKQAEELDLIEDPLAAEDEAADDADPEPLAEEDYLADLSESELEEVLGPGAAAAEDQG